MHRETESILGLILAGGKGTRVGGADKGLLVYEGKPMVIHVAECLVPQCEKVLISANRNLERYQSFGFEVEQNP